MQKINKIAITDEVLAKIHTDSDIYEVAEEMGIKENDLVYAINNKFAEGTPCYNCENVGCFSFYPCNSCSRIHTEDFYKEVEFKE